MTKRNKRPSLERQEIQKASCQLSETPIKRLRQLEDAVASLLRDDVTISEVVIRRLGLLGLAREGREAIGASLGLSVSDVWFAERIGFSRVQKLFSEGKAGAMSLHPELVAFSEHFRMAVHQAPRRDVDCVTPSVCSLEDFRWALAGLTGFSPSLEEGIALFFLDWCDVVIDPYDDRRTFVYRSQDVDNRALFRRHLSQVEREWERGLRGQALARRCPFAARGLVVTLGQVLSLLGLREQSLGETG